MSELELKYRKLFSDDVVPRTPPYRQNYYINIRNNSRTVVPTSKKQFRLVNPKCFSAQNSKQLSYFVRLYYHYQYVKAIGGQCYFYTLTYNDGSLPHFMGIRCFNHDHIRNFFRSSGFDKRLIREYGLRVQYFVSCELGDGKGSRGISGNPHYHVILFLVPDDNYPQSHLSSEALQELVREYWCGKDYKKRRKQDYRFGIAMPGNHLGLVESAAALSYAAKYVIKDTVYETLYSKLSRAAKEHIYECLIKKREACRIYQEHARKCFLPKDNPDVHAVVNRLFDRLYKKEIRRLYMPRVRISQGIGLYCIDHVNDDGITINMPHPKKGVIKVSLPLYVYRKMYYDVVTAYADGKFVNKYVLNDRGISLRVNNFDRDLDKRFRTVDSLLDFYKMDRTVYTDEVLNRYALYDLVYRDRLCPDFYKPLNPLKDYEFFLISDYFKTNYLDELEAIVRREGLFDSPITSLPTYAVRPYFSEMLNLFNNLDKMLEEHYICQSNSAEQQFIDNKRVKSHISKDKFNNYVNQL